MSESNPYDVTRDEPGTRIWPEGSATAPPERIGRYRIQSVLGSGGFGLVYLALDEQLDRRVAIKVPHADLVTKPEDAVAYLGEARTVANLDHPCIVPVHDVGSTEDFPCYVVSKYIEGTNLATKLQERRLKYREAAELVATVAEALHYAHKQGLVHRDIKPGNILIGSDGRAWVADFGLALREENIGRGPKYAGTPAYMSPEQARGEGHRVDGRSDVFSLGVVFYEMLAGRKPFRGDTVPELLDQVTTYEPRPLLQYDERLPKELQRICLKALAKRASERYSSAYEMAEDLRVFLAEQTEVHSGTSPSGMISVPGEPSPSTHSFSAQGTAGSVSAAPGSVATSDVAAGRQSADDNQPIRIVPRGLRSFDAHDADFFRDLLPGPRDREGLPDSLRFWKTRTEETDPDNTFPVGLIYGPSGCGKSSLVRAGLLPRLSDDVITVYVEATADDTEARVLHGLRKRCPALNENLNLRDSLAAVRRGQCTPADRKVLIVIDQFEQWLHAKKEEENTELVEALRQCDGGRLQCLVMVRDDFWMAATRFMRDLEVRLIEGHNSAAVDLFPIRHAEKVMTAFGMAFGILPEDFRQLTREQSAFIVQAVAGLAEDGKVVCVRLALFAEMMKGKAWTTASLREVGGAEGVGLTFLEETFSASTSPPEHRYHQKAARAVLRALLPDSGTDIKGHMRSRSELLEISGYQNRPRDFDDLVRILDSEIRLITPTDPELQDADHDAVSRTPTGSRYFQLTHDYLVHSLREWLTRRQKETRKGRAELKLAERAAMWNTRPENRYLPSLAEWLSIRTLTRRKQWTAPQQVMMRRAGQVHGLRIGVASVLLIVALVGGISIRNGIEARQRNLLAQQQQERERIEAELLVKGLLDADTGKVQNSIESLSPFHALAEPQLLQAFEQSPAESTARFHAGLALVANEHPFDPKVLQFLGERILTVSPARLAVVQELLAQHRDSLATGWWTTATDPEQATERRFRAACALAAFDPDNAAWQDDNLAELVAEGVLSDNPIHIGHYQELLRPVAIHLVGALKRIFEDAGRPELTKSLAVSLLSDFAADDPLTLSDLLLSAEPATDRTLLQVLLPHRESAVTSMQAVLAQRLDPDWSDIALDPAWTEPSAAVRARLETAHGMITERFAFCQDMPWDTFLSITESLRASGYRPTKVRPYPAAAESVASARAAESETRGDSNPDSIDTSLSRDNLRLVTAGPDEVESRVSAEHLLVAAVWTRDGRHWELQTGVTGAELPAPDAPAVKDGLLLLDLAAIPTADSSAEVRYVALWSEPDAGDEDRRVIVDLPEVRLEDGPVELMPDFHVAGISVRNDAAGRRWYTAVITSRGAPSEISASYAGFERVSAPQWDVATAPVASRIDPLEASRLDLLQIQGLPADEREMPQSLRTRYEANYRLGNLHDALADIDLLTANGQARAYETMYRTLTLARLGRADEAQESLTAFLTTRAPDSIKAYAQIVVSVCGGESDLASEQIRSAVADSGDNAGDLYNIACAVAAAAGAVSGDQTEQAERLANQAFEVLQQAVALGYSDVTKLKSDPDLVSLHALPAFQDLLSSMDRPQEYAAVWRTDPTVESALLSRVPLASVADALRPLLAAGYRPVAIAVDPRSSRGSRVVAGPAIAPCCSLVLHRPLVPDSAKDELARQQAAAATVLLRLNAAEHVWPLFREQPDPRLRTFLLHRLAPFGVDPQSLITQLGAETEVSRQRALILALGEYAKAGLLSDDQRHAVTADLARRCTDDPDSGIHAAAEWTLKQLGADATISEVREAFSTGANIGDRRWYLTRSGLTLVVIDPPGEFLMGSPVTEANRVAANEGRHRRLISRRFAIGAHEVTVAQFLRFRSAHESDREYAVDDRAPANKMFWYEAAEFCNWLSAQEGIEESQWCYTPAPAAGSSGIRLYREKEHSLDLSGYRLPTEAEWEYACRAGTLTARSFGETSRLMSEYAWDLGSSQFSGMLPVGTLKPNDLGLFDMHGNAMEWCHDWLNKYDVTLEWISDQQPSGRATNRVIRGGAFSNFHSRVRSPYRTSLPPNGRNFDIGFRVARTLPQTN